MTKINSNIPFSKLLRLVEKLKSFNIQSTDPVEFEYIISFLFPSIWNNIQQFGTDCYTKGFLEGKKSNEN